MRISDWSSDVCSSDLPLIICFCAVSEHDGLVPVLENAMLGVPADGARQHRCLDIAADRDHFVGGGAMADAAHILFDDRPFIEIGRHEMRRRPDDLHSARMRLMIGFRSEEHTSELQSLMRISY